jgi:hypothetical protein
LCIHISPVEWQKTAAINSKRKIKKRSINMSDTMINSICIIIGALIGFIGNFLFNKKIRPSKLINNGFEMPSPSVCSSESKADVDIEEGYCFSFDFSDKDGQVYNKDDFASLYFKFDESINLKKYKKCSFEICKISGCFNNLDVEMKKENEDRANSVVLKCNPNKAWETHEIDLSDVKMNNVRDKLQEICFVVKYNYTDVPKKCNGEVRIRNLKFY